MEVKDLGSAVSRVERAWGKVQETVDDRDLFLDSVALNLHGFYSGLERIFELVARHVDGGLPAVPAWHEQLLLAMTQEVAAVRPAVVSRVSAEGLDEYRRFRHLVRNVYATNLLPERISSLVEALPVIWEKLNAELSAFADFLDAAHFKERRRASLADFDAWLAASPGVEPDPGDEIPER